MNKFLLSAKFTLMLWLSCALSVATAQLSNYEQAAKQIIDTTGVKGGLIVHIGCDDGKLTAALFRNESYLVQGLDTKTENVENARKYIEARGIYGPVSVDQFDGKQLPYTDNLVNLLVAEDIGDVPMAEVMRVLCPNGVAYIKEDGQWNKTVKAWPGEIDEWTHYLHDSSNNPVAQDSVVGPPRHVQWQCLPKWSRSHAYTPSLSAMVSARGRIFYIMDEGLIGVADARFDRWRLCARDAFNGLLLWKRHLPEWGTLIWKSNAEGPKSGNWSSPTTLPRRLVAVGDRVFVTLGYRQPVSILDADTGEIIKTLEQTKYTEEILWNSGVLIVRKREKIPDSSGHHAWSAEAIMMPDGGPKIPPGASGDQIIMAVDPETGKTLWEWPTKRLVTLSLAACEGRVCYHNLDEIVCLDMRTGKELWRVKSHAWPTRMGTAGTLVMYEDMVFFTGDYGLQAISAKTGEEMWKGPRVQRSSPWQPPDLLVVDDLLWGGLTPEMADCRFPQLRAPEVAASMSGKYPNGLDPRTGEVRRVIDIGKLISPGHHVRCYRSKASQRYLIYNKRGMEFVNIAGGTDHARCDWTRGECNYGVMPANGLLYVPPHPCACYRGALRSGFFAYAAKRTNKVPDHKDPPLEQGSAYGKVEPHSLNSNTGGEWQTYRHDPERSGATEYAVPTDLTKIWSTRMDGRLSAPVIANGKVFVASVNTHTVQCLDAVNGRVLWSYTAGARIDTPPTIYHGLALFGCRNGWVYALRATDGSLVWRLQAAPTDRLVVDNGQLESAWPVHGSVLIKDGLAYFAAGRSSFLDGGIYLYAVKPETGEIVYRTNMDGPWPDTTKDSGHPYWVDGSEAYLLVTGREGKHIYMAQEVFSLELKAQQAPVTNEWGIREMGLHLAPMSDFTDDTWYHRTAWRYCKGWPGVPYAPEGPKSGQILVFDGDNTYAVRAYNEQYGHNPAFTAGKHGYMLCADDNNNEAVRPKGYRIYRDRPSKWSASIPIRAQAMVLADKTLFLAGPPNIFPDEDCYAALEGRRGAKLWAVSAKTGKKLSERKLDLLPVFDGMAAAYGRLYLSTTSGILLCIGD